MLPFELESLLSKTWETILEHSPRKAARLRSCFSILPANGEKSWKRVISVCKIYDALQEPWCFAVNWLKWHWNSLNWSWIEIELTLNFIQLTLNFIELKLNFIELTLNLSYLLFIILFIIYYIFMLCPQLASAKYIDTWIKFIIIIIIIIIIQLTWNFIVKLKLNWYWIPLNWNWISLNWH